jgi:hypothetical protein
MEVLSEDAIARHYGATIDVVPVGDRLAVVPRRTTGAKPGPGRGDG